jgi:S1-C subfamily serine protease
MKPLPLVVCFWAFAACGYSQPTANVLSHVFQIRFDGHTATTFLLDYEDRQYFVTARHLMEAATTGTATVEVAGPDIKGWKPYPVRVLLGKDKCVDVAVLVPGEKRISNAEPIPYPYVFAFGQEAYFLGFPYGLYTHFGDQGGVALIKHAYVSARVSCAAIYPDGDTEDQLILLDGFNNPGFSGGPIVAPDMFSPFTTVREQKLIGVISGFKTAGGTIEVDKKEVPNALAVMNSGIMFATPIEKAVDLIKTYAEKQKHP